MTTKFRVAAHDPNGSRRGSIPTPSSFNFASPMNEVSSADIEVKPNSINAEMMLDFVELSVEASYDGGATWQEIPNGRYMSKERNYELVGAFNVRKYTLNGYGWQLNKAIQWDTTNLNADGKRPFLSATVGTILKTLIDEAQARGTIPGLEYTFDTSLDTNGAAWDKIITIYYEPGLSIYSILDNLAQQGMCDWRFQGRELQVYNADTVMATIRDANLKLGVDIKALPVKASIADLIDKALVIGDGGVTVELENTLVTLPWGHWEGSISNGGVSDTGTMTLLGQTLLDDNGHEKIQYTCEVKRDTTTYFPFQDFVPGEYITAPTEDVGTSQSFRVRQINGRMDGNGNTDIDLVVNDRFVERELRNAKKTNGIVGGATAGGSGGRPAPPPTEGDTREPKQVLGLVTSSSTYLDSQGVPQAVAFLDWDAVTEATNETAMDIQNYAVEVRDNEEGNPDWKVLTYSEADATSYSPFRVGGNYSFRISAVGKNGIWGAASAISTLVMSVDATPPPIPSTPTADVSLGVISLSWDGLSNIAGSMGSDFSHVEVAFGDTATPTTVINHMFASGTIQVEPSLAPLLTDRYSRLRAVDTSGNVSDWGAALGPIQAQPVTDTDLSDTVNDAIDEALNGEVDGGRLAPWTIGPDRMIIGVGEQKLANPGFESGDISQWLPGDSLTFAAVTTTVRSGDYAGRVTMADSAGLQTAAHGTSSLSDHLQNMAVAVDDIIYGSIWLQMESGTADANVLLRVYDAAGGILSFEVGSTASVPTGSWQKFEAEGTIFSTAAAYAVLSVEVSNTSSAVVLMDDGILRQKMQGHLIVDGTITAGKIAADAITADKIAANAVTAASISAGAIDGKLITGATIRTDASTTRLEMDSSSFTAYSSGNVQFEITPSNVFAFGARLGTIDTQGIELGPGASGYGDTFEPRGSLVEGWLHLEQRDTGDTQVNHTWDIGGDGFSGTGVPTNSTISLSARGPSGATTDEASMTLMGNGWDNLTALRLLGAGSEYIGGGSFPSNGAPSVYLRVADGSWTSDTGDGPLVAINAQKMEFNTGNRMHWYAQDLDIHMGDEVNFFSPADAVVDQLARDSSMLHIEPEGVFIATGTTGNSANIWTASNGALRRTTSARRYKQDIEDMDIDPLTILKLRPRTWRDKQEVREDPDTTHRLPGFIAEEVHEAGLGLFVVYDQENNPEALSYDRVSAAHQLVLKWLDARLSALEAKV